MLEPPPTGLWRSSTPRRVNWIRNLSKPAFDPGPFNLLPGMAQRFDVEELFAVPAARPAELPPALEP